MAKNATSLDEVTAEVKSFTKATFPDALKTIKKEIDKKFEKYSKQSIDLRMIDILVYLDFENFFLESNPKIYSIRNR